VKAEKQENVITSNKTKPKEKHPQTVLPNRWRESLGPKKGGQKAMAEFLGVSHPQISQWLRCGRVPDQYKLQWATHVGRDLNWLLRLDKLLPFNERFENLEWRKLLEDDDFILCDMCGARHSSTSFSEIHRVNSQFVCSSCVGKHGLWKKLI
tara:strand:+ start:1535 stop:1990 length:456 start_codon:yes stop_codon:yes gene_type:complete